MKIGYLHIGPERSGVRRYGVLIAQEADRHAGLDVLEVGVSFGDDAKDSAAAIEAAARRLNEADVVHIQYNKKVWGGDRAHVGRLAGFVRTLPGKLVVTLHDVYTPVSASSMLRGLTGFRRNVGLMLDSSGRSNRMLGQSAAALIVHSHVEVGRLKRIAPGSRLHVIPHFVEQRSSVPGQSAAKTELGLSSRRVVTLLGFILPRKGYGLLLDALPLLPDDVDLIFAGGAPVGGDRYVEELRRRVEDRGLSGRVRLTGYLSEPELERYLSATDLAVCPFEGVSASGSLATWISVAKPILASDLPQFREYNELEDGAVDTFAPYTFDALADAINRLLPRCGVGEQQSVARVRDQLSMPRIFERHLAVYEQVALTSRQPAPSGRSSNRGQQGGAGSTLRVAFLPLWLGNPYQARLEQELAALGVRMRRLGRTAGSIVTRMLLERPRILHLHWLHPFHESRSGLLSLVKLLFSVFGFALMRLLGVRIVWTAHNLRHHEGKNALLDRAITRFVVRYSHAIIAHCPSAKRQILEEFRAARPDRVHVIPHGNYCDAYENVVDRHDARNRWAIAENTTVFLFLGQVRPYKGVLDMVEAFKGMNADKALLIIAGKPLTEDAGALVREATGGDRRIRFDSGFVAEADIQVYMNASDVVVLPYRNIFTSGAAVLAMSFGRACIAPRLGCMVDWFEDGGAFLYDPEDESGLRRSMARAITCSDHLRDMGERNASVASEWAWERVARDTLEVYRSVAGRRTGGGMG